jgi:hypothetical protein
MVANLENIFCVTRKMVADVRKIFSFVQNMVRVVQTIFTMTQITVTAAKNVVSGTPTIFRSIALGVLGDGSLSPPPPMRATGLNSVH